MGSKAPFPSTRPPGDLLDDTAQELMLPGRSALQLRLRRVADALQVPESALYNPPGSAAPERSAERGLASSTGLDQECEALLHAYKRIQDPKIRQRLLALVQKAVSDADMRDYPIP